MPKKYTEEEPTVFDFFRFGESYTSLILGIIVVIVSTVLLLSFVHNKNKKSTSSNENTQIVRISPTPKAESSVTIKLTPTVKHNPTATLAPKIVKKVQPTAKPTVKVSPTKYMAKSVTPTQMKKNPTAVAIVNKPSAKVESKGTYTVMRGDNLWTIAEKNYKSGYNWVDIARVNKLSNPNSIHAGDKLVLPKVAPKMATVVTPTKPVIQPTKVVAKVTPVPTKAVANLSPAPSTVAVQPGVKITGASYTVMRGDNLWNIAVRSYGDGYQWVKIAKANNLTNPRLIHSGNVLMIPR